MAVAYRKIGWLALALLASGVAWAQAPTAGPATPLAQAFWAAWQRQPEAQSQVARQQAASAQRAVANSWTPEPASLELSHKSDRLNSNLGSREDALAVAWALWLPGERARQGALAEAEVRANASRVLAAQLRTAASVREAYWPWQQARGEQALAQARLGHAQQLAADVAKRVKAGDLARADQHQAEAALAQAEFDLAEAASALALAAQSLRALTGAAPLAAPEPAPAEPVPEPRAEAALLPPHHPALGELADRLDVASRAAELAQVQSRGNPELTLEMARDRGQYGETYQSSLSVGVRIPLGSDSRHRAKLANAQAEQIEAESQLRLEQESLLAQRESARARLDLARAQRAAADKRAQLAREASGFFQKSYQLGETDWATRLRIELEAVEAERQAGRSRIELAAAVSALRQSLGLLPE